MNKPKYPAELPYPIVETVLYGDLLIVRLEPPVGTIFNRNVFALTSDGHTKWQIEESPHGTVAEKPYVRISFDSTGSLVASNWIGIDYCVDPKDGRIRTKAFNK